LQARLRLLNMSLDSHPDKVNVLLAIENAHAADDALALRVPPMVRARQAAVSRLSLAGTPQPNWLLSAPSRCHGSGTWSGASPPPSCLDPEPAEEAREMIRRTKATAAAVDAAAPAPHASGRQGKRRAPLNPSPATAERRGSTKVPRGLGLNRDFHFGPD
jgi:hypothetical protein